MKTLSSPIKYLILVTHALQISNKQIVHDV